MGDQADTGITPGQTLVRSGIQCGNTVDEAMIKVDVWVTAGDGRESMVQREDIDGGRGVQIQSGQSANRSTE